MTLILVKKKLRITELNIANNEKIISTKNRKQNDIKKYFDEFSDQREYQSRSPDF